MITVHKKIVLDGKGKPTEVIIPWVEYREAVIYQGFHNEPVEGLRREVIKNLFPTG